MFSRKEFSFWSTWRFQQNPMTDRKRHRFLVANLLMIWLTCLSCRRAKISTWTWKLSKLTPDQGEFICQIFKGKQFQNYLLVPFNFQSSFMHVVWSSQLPQDATGQVSSSPCLRWEADAGEMRAESSQKIVLQEHLQLHKGGRGWLIFSLHTKRQCCAPWERQQLDQVRRIPATCVICVRGKGPICSVASPITF